MDDADDRPSARPPDPEDVVRICRSLNETGARYVLIGGFAMIAHGADRTTSDIDLLVDDDPANVARVRAALGVLADGAVSEVGDSDIRSYTVVRVADEVIVDLMGRACGLAFADLETEIEERVVDGVRIPVLSKRGLIRTKETLRPMDAVDRAFLARRIEEEEKGSP